MATLKTHKRYTLSMTKSEKEWLQGYLQNWFHSRDEELKELKIRTELFNKLKG